MSNGLAQFVDAPKIDQRVDRASNLLIQGKLSELIEIYEFMRKWRREKTELRKFIAGQAMRDGIATIRNDQGFLTAAAFFGRCPTRMTPQGRESGLLMSQKGSTFSSRPASFGKIAVGTSRLCATFCVDRLKGAQRLLELHGSG